jgi:hypothetical protein
VREAVAAVVVRIAKVAGSRNLADLFTKKLGKGDFLSHIRNILFLPNAHWVDNDIVWWIMIAPKWSNWFIIAVMELKWYIKTYDHLMGTKRYL